ncbi:hypothetical protein AAG747_00615 [Rapidithrix thailandica]|uniref:Por secretion system C-terminal sorting domain-containing protein n=1 Tax=Rapidithrix thailandica TaxID=413964 RepID=A0AAW9RNA0_9BACT
MKKSTVLIFSFLFSLISMISFAENKKHLAGEKATAASVGLAYNYYVVQNSPNLRFAFKNTKPGTVNISLYNKKNELVFNKAYVNKEFSNNNINLENFGNGQYSLKIEKGPFVEYHVLHVGERTVNELSPYDVFVTSQFKQEQVLVSFTNAVTPTSIVITNDAGKVVHKDEVNKTHFNTLISTQKFREGAYTVTITGSEKSESHRFWVKNTKNLNE